MTRRRLPAGRVMPSHRDQSHPAIQALGLTRSWLRDGPQTHRQLEARAQGRGVSVGRVNDALRAMVARGDVSVTSGPTAQLRYSLNDPAEVVS